MIDIIEIEVNKKRPESVSLKAIEDLVQETEYAFRDAETILIDAAKNYAKAEENYERSLVLLREYKERSK